MKSEGLEAKHKDLSEYGVGGAAVWWWLVCNSPQQDGSHCYPTRALGSCCKEFSVVPDQGVVGAYQLSYWQANAIPSMSQWLGTWSPNSGPLHTGYFIKKFLHDLEKCSRNVLYGGM